MKAAQIKDKLILTQEMIDFIMDQPLPPPEIMSKIKEAAKLGVCQGSSYLNVYQLGILLARNGEGPELIE